MAIDKLSHVQGTDHYFFPGGIVIEKKVVCMRKIAEINRSAPEVYLK